MRFRVAFLVALFTAVPTFAEPPKPQIVVRTQPLSRLLTEYKEMIRQVGGPIEGDRIVKKFDAELKDVLGDQGFEGFDLNRPLAAYAVLAEKQEDCYVVLVAPTTGEKEFVAFLERVQIKAAAVKDKNGLYTIEFPEDIFPKTSHLRFVGGWAYLTLNDGEPIDPKNLVPIGDLLDNADASLISAKLFPGRVPEKLLAHALDELDQTAGGLKMLFAFQDEPGAKFILAIFDQGPKLIRRYAETGLKEAAELSLTFGFDSASGNTVTEVTLTPRPGTNLAKDIAARQAATTNRFAGMVPKDAAGAILLKMPVFAKELQEIVTALFESSREEFKNPEIPEKLRAVVEESTEGLIRTVKTGNLDVAIVLLGPDKDGKFTLLAGASYDDTTAVEKAFREAAKTPLIGKAIELDAAKIGGVSIHKVPLAMALPKDAAEEAKKLFGENAPGYIVFMKDAAIVTIGSTALDAIKAAVEAKPGPAPVVDVSGNAKRLQKLVAAIDEKAGAEFSKHVGTDDKTVNALRVSVKGGQALKVKAHFNVRYIPKFFLLADEPAPPR